MYFERFSKKIFHLENKYALYCNKPPIILYSMYWISFFKQYKMIGADI